MPTSNHVETMEPSAALLRLAEHAARLIAARQQEAARADR